MWQGTGMGQKVVLPAYIYSRNDSFMPIEFTYKIPTESRYLSNVGRELSKKQTGAYHDTLMQYSFNLGGFNSDRVEVVNHAIIATRQDGTNSITVNFPFSSAAVGSVTYPFQPSKAYSGKALEEPFTPVIQPYTSTLTYDWRNINKWTGGQPVHISLNLAELGRQGKAAFAPASSSPVTISIYMDALTVGNNTWSFDTDNDIVLLIGETLGNSYTPSVVYSGSSYSGSSGSDEPAYVSVYNQKIFEWADSGADTRTHLLSILPVLKMSDQQSSHWPKSVAFRITVAVTY